MRAAISYTPAQDDPLTRCAAEWLGRDTFAGGRTRPSDAMLDPHVVVPARFGFQATLKAPFRIATGQSLDDLRATLMRFSRTCDDLPIGQLAVDRIDGDIVLAAPKASSRLGALEAELRTKFDAFRAPLNDNEFAQNRPERLTVRQQDNLMRWGFPHVGPDFRIHMTLATDAAGGTASHGLEERLRAHLHCALLPSVVIDTLTLFVEPAPGEPFRVLARCPLRAPMPIGVLAP